MPNINLLTQNHVFSWTTVWKTLYRSMYFNHKFGLPYASFELVRVFQVMAVSKRFAKYSNNIKYYMDDFVVFF